MTTFVKHHQATVIKQRLSPQPDVLVEIVQSSTSTSDTSMLIANVVERDDPEDMLGSFLEDFEEAEQGGQGDNAS